MTIKNVTFSLDENLNKEFSNFCKSNCLKKSAIANKLIAAYLKKKSNQNKEIDQY